ncbi:MAG: cytochrome P450 [Gammaproteobacteria bacterium]
MSRLVRHPLNPAIRLMDPAFHAEPLAHYAWLRAHAPVYWDADAPLWKGRGAWGISRYADIRAVHADHETFASRFGSRPDAPPVPSMINRDAPEHLARRGINRRRFTPAAVRRYEAYVREVAVELIEGVRGRGGCDLVRDLAMPLPMRIIGRMMDLPDADYARLLEWSDLIATGLPEQTPEFIAAVLAAAAEFEAYITGWLERRRVAPGDDLLSAIANARVLGDPLGAKDQVHEALLLLVGGDETTRHVLTGGIVALLDQHDDWQALAAAPARIPSAVEEMLRWVTPVKTIARSVTRDVELGGERLLAGDRVILLYESGNRDERAFDAPERFDIAREPNRHLAFGGYGRHHCLGAHLARLEIRVMLEELLARLPKLARADAAPLPRRHGTFVLGFEAVPVVF